MNEEKPAINEDKAARREEKAARKEEKAARNKEEKGAKRERKRLASTNEALDIRERLRNQWEVLGLERRMLEAMDQSVRYGLIIFTTANTLAAILLSRAEFLSALTPGALLATRLLGVVYAVVAIWILLHAARSLRPAYTPEEHAKIAVGPSSEHAARPLTVLQTLLPTGADHATLAGMHDSWKTITGEELSWELTQACLVLRGLIELKYHALRRLYASLGIMLMLAAAFGVVCAIIAAG